MTGERLLTFLQNPALMDGTTYQEMKTLTLNYPYSASLRMLLLLKSEQEKHWEKGRNLALASLYSPDRKRLYCLLSPKMGIVRVTQTIPAEQVLELKPLAKAEQLIAERKAAEQKSAPAPSPAKAAEAPVFFENLSADRQEKVEAETPIVVFEQKPVAAPGPVFLTKEFVFADWYGQFVLPVLPKKQPRIFPRPVDGQPVAAKKVAAQPAPVRAAQTARPAEPKIETKKEVEPPVPTASPAAPDEKEREAAVKKLVKKSVKEKDEIASETLAKLYAMQGYRDRAEAMYRKLMVVFPEKSATFAAEIEKLGR